MVEHKEIDGVEYITFALRDFKDIEDAEDTPEYHVDDYFFDEDPINVVADDENARKWAGAIAIGIPEDWAFEGQKVVTLGDENCQEPVSDEGWAFYELLQERWTEGVLTDIKVTLKVVKTKEGYERYEFVRATVPTPEELNAIRTAKVAAYKGILEFGIF